MACQNCGFFDVVYKRGEGWYHIIHSGLWREVKNCPNCKQELKLSPDFVHHIKHKDLEAMVGEKK